MISRSKVRHLRVLAIVALAAAGCSSPMHIVHRINVSQGDYFDSSQLQKLKIGLTKDQVLCLLGKPVVNDQFAAKNTLLYLSWQRKGHHEPTQKTLRLHFDDQNRLARIERDFSESEMNDSNFPDKGDTLPHKNFPNNIKGR